MTKNLSDSAPQTLTGEGWTASLLDAEGVAAHYAKLNYTGVLNPADNVVYGVRIDGYNPDRTVEVAMNLRSLAAVGRTPFDSVQGWVTETLADAAK